MNMSIDELKDLRVQLNVGTEDVAKYLGITRGAIGHWGKHRYIPSESMLEKYEKFLQDVIDGKIKAEHTAQRGYSPKGNTVSRERVQLLKRVRKKLCLTLPIVARHVPLSASTICDKENYYLPTSEEQYKVFMAYYKEVKLQRIFGANYKKLFHGGD